MSHRVTTQTKITNKKIAIEALKLAGWSYSESSNKIRVTSGPMNRSVIDLSTGNVVGDSDWHSQKELGALRRHYSEAQIREEAIKSGHTVESREVLQNGDIRLVMSGNLG